MPAIPIVDNFLVAKDAIPLIKRVKMHVASTEMIITKSRCEGVASHCV